MSNAASISKTAYADLDWTRYTKYRPTYPNSLRDLLYKYHTSHSPSLSTAHWETLVDIGGGIGISSIPFVGDFDTVHLIDPSPLNIEKGQVFLGQHVAAHGLQTKLEFTAAKAEESAGDQSAAEGRASLAICATAAHFIDSPKLVKAIYDLLQPGGTLAIYSYHMPVFDEAGEALSVAYAKAATKAMRLCVRDEFTRALFVETAARMCAGTGHLDAIAVPEDLFEDVQRILINPQAELALKVYQDDPPVPCVPLPSQVDPRKPKTAYIDGRDPEAEGWGKSVDMEWLHGMLHTLLPSDLQLSDEQKEDLFGEFDRLFATTCPSGSVRALWGCDIILATKKIS